MFEINVLVYTLLRSESYSSLMLFNVQEFSTVYVVYDVVKIFTLKMDG